jgi:Tol biopolymer transport system component
MKTLKLTFLFVLFTSLSACAARETQSPGTMPTLAASPEAQKKEILLLNKTDRQHYYLSDFSGSEIIPLELPGEMDTISMSPDGRMVAYMPVTSGENARSTIYLLDINSKKAMKLTDSRVMVLSGALLAWSPDSREILFSCGMQGTKGISICSTDITGPDAVKVLVKSEVLNVANMLDGAVAPSWSAEGSKIVFQSFRTPLTMVEGVKTEVPVDLWTFDIATQQAKRVFVSDTDGIAMIMRPVFLPGENAVLFSGRKDTYNTIFKYDLDTQEIQDITASGHRFDLTDILLNPDGKTFLTYIPVPDDGSQGYVPVLYSVDGVLIKQLDALKNMQVISWGEQ